MTLPDVADKSQSPERSPAIVMPPLDVDAWTAPRTPRRRTDPDPDETSTFPLPVCVTSMRPLPVFAVMAPLTSVAAIEPLPVVA